VLGNQNPSVAWLITSLVFVAYVVVAYLLLRGEYLAYLIYAASLNLLFSIVSMQSNDFRAFAIAGFVYAFGLIILHSTGLIKAEDQTPAVLSFVVVIISAIIFTIKSLTVYDIGSLWQVGIICILLALYFVAFARLYKSTLSDDSLINLDCLGAIFLSIGASLIGMSIAKEARSLQSALPLFLGAIGSAGYAISKKITAQARLDWLMSSLVLIGLAVALSTFSPLLTVAILGAYGLVALLVALTQKDFMSPFLSVGALLGALAVWLSLILKADTGNSIIFASVIMLAFSVGLSFKKLNQSIFALVAVAAWAIAIATALVSSSYGPAGAICVMGAASCLLWRNTFDGIPFYRIALVLSAVAPIIGFANSYLAVGCFASLFIILVWVLLVVGKKQTPSSSWWAMLGALITFVLAISVIFVDKNINWLVMLTAGFVAFASLIAITTQEAQDYIKQIFVVLTVIAVTTSAGFLFHLKGFEGVLAATIASALIYAICALWFMYYKTKIPAEKRITTYIRVTAIAVYALTAFAPTVVVGLSGPYLFAILALMLSPIVMIEGYLINKATLRYGGSAVIILAIMQLMKVSGIDNIHLYTHVLGLYFAALAYVVYKYRQNTAQANNLLLVAVVIPLGVLTLYAFNGNTAASLAVLLESSIITVLAAVFWNKQILYVSVGVLLVSLVYRISSYLARIPTWVWYLVVGGSLIAIAAYLLTKSNNKDASTKE